MASGREFVAAVKAGFGVAGFGLDQPILVAFSGGPDSTALLMACAEIWESSDAAVRGAHLNHGLRGAESDADASFAETTCRALRVPLSLGNADVQGHSRTRGLSLEAAARELRYEFLATTASEHGAGAVATGHTMDDQAETVLLHLARGSGVGGLAGMLPSMDREPTGSVPAVRVVRPLLGVRRADTVEYCRSRGIEPRSDPSNLERKFSRNRIRLDVLPALEHVNPRAVEAIARLAENAAADSALINDTVAEHQRALEAADGGLVRAALTALPEALARRILMAKYAEAAGTSVDLAKVHIDDMLIRANARAGASLDLPGGVRFEVEYETVRFVVEDEADGSCPFPSAVPAAVLNIPGTTHLPGGFQLNASVCETPGDLSAGAPWVAHVRGTLTDGQLKVRARRDGDRFQPLGMSESVKLQDFFVGAHVPVSWRDRVPIIESDRGIAWLAGCRPAEWARANLDDDEVLRLELVRPPKN